MRPAGPIEKGALSGHAQRRSLQEDEVWETSKGRGPFSDRDDGQYTARRVSSGTNTTESRPVVLPDHQAVAICPSVVLRAPKKLQEFPHQRYTRYPC